MNCNVRSPSFTSSSYLYVYGFNFVSNAKVVTVHCKLPDTADPSRRGGGQAIRPGLTNGVFHENGRVRLLMKQNLVNLTADNETDVITMGW